MTEDSLGSGRRWCKHEVGSVIWRKFFWRFPCHVHDFHDRRRHGDTVFGQTAPIPCRHTLTGRPQCCGGSAENNRWDFEPSHFRFRFRHFRFRYFWLQSFLWTAGRPQCVRVQQTVVQVNTLDTWSARRQWGRRENIGWWLKYSILCHWSSYKLSVKTHNLLYIVCYSVHSLTPCTWPSIQPYSSALRHMYR